MNTLVSEFPVSVNDLFKDVKVNAFPNPFDDFTTIHISGLAINAEANLNLYQPNGQLIKKYVVGRNTKLLIAGGELPAGVYFYEITNHSMQLLARGKLVKL